MRLSRYRTRLPSFLGSQSHFPNKRRPNTGPYNVSMPKTRNTDRKRTIQAVLAETAGTPIVLEELRWSVMRKELAEEKEPLTMMTEAYQKSFNRTLRTFLSDLAPGLSIHRIDAGWTAGLLARVAVYRMDRVAQIDRFLDCQTPSLHFWTNSRTADVWDEVSDGEVEVRDEALLPENAPGSLETLYPYGSRWPRSSTQRQEGLQRLGPKWIKKPLVCIKVCARDVETPEDTDVLAKIRMPTNQPMLVIANAGLEGEALQKMGPVPWRLYQRKRGVTRVIPARKVIR
jgi:hypothetical protein